MRIIVFLASILFTLPVCAQPFSMWRPYGTAAVRPNGSRGVVLPHSTAPSTAPADLIQMWAADRAAGNSRLYVRSEAGVNRPFQQVFNVMDYGATQAETAANNRTYIQAAITAAGAGDVVLIPRDSAAYSVDNTTPLSIAAQVTLIVQGEINFTIDTADFCDVTGDDVVVIGQGGKIQGPGTFDHDEDETIASAVFHVTGDRFTCRGLTIEDPVQAGLWLQGSADSLIDGNLIIGGDATDPTDPEDDWAHYAIELDDAGTTQCVVVNNKVLANASSGICIQGVGCNSTVGGYNTIANNTFGPCWDHGIYSFGDYNIIANNVFNQTGNSAIKHVGDFTVCDGNVIHANGAQAIEFRNCDGATITDNLIEDCGFTGIDIREYGTYSGNFDNLVITGNSMTGDGGADVDSGIYVDISDQSGDNIVITNNLITDMVTTAASGEAGIVITSDSDTVGRVQIHGNVIHGSGRQGILVDHIDSGVISSNLIQNPGVDTASNGIELLSNCDHVIVDNNVILDEKGIPDMPYGIDVTPSVSNTNILCRWNKIVGAQTGEILITSTEGQVFSINSAGGVGIGIASAETSSLFHILESNSSAAVHGDTVVAIEKNDHLQLEILTANDKTGAIFFSDNGGAGRGRIEYSHAGPDQLKFYTAGTLRQRITSTGRTELVSDNTVGAELLTLNQADVDKAFLDFDGDGSIPADTTENISSVNGDGSVEGPKNYSSSAGWQFEGMVKVEVNGAEFWMPYYSIDVD